MATKKKAARKKAPPKKKRTYKKKPPVLNLKGCTPGPGPHLACEPAPRLYMEGTPWPDWIADEFKARLEMYDKGITERLEKKYAPANDIETAVKNLFHHLSGLQKGDSTVALAHFFNQLKKRKESNADLARKAQAMTDEMVAFTSDDLDNLNRIMRGDFAVLLPLKTMQPGGLTAPNDGTKHEGEAVVSKRATN